MTTPLKVWCYWKLIMQFTAQNRFTGSLSGAMKRRKAVLTKCSCVSGLFFENGWRRNQRKHSSWPCTFKYQECRQISPRRQYHHVPNKWCVLKNDMHLITWAYGIFSGLVIHVSTKAFVHFKGQTSLILFLFIQFGHAFINYSTCSMKNIWRVYYMYFWESHGCIVQTYQYHP